MRMRHYLSAATVAFTIGAGPGLAQEMAIHPYASKHNYCPAGLQPVVVGGVICCGTPNQHVSYQQSIAMAPAVKIKRTHKRASAQIDCPAGVKGCG